MKKSKPINIDQITIINAWHANMGYVADGSGRHKGYAYGYRCVEYPRFTFEDRHFTLDDGGWEREYMVDGQTCKFEDIPRLLAQPPQLSLIEFVCVLRMEDKELPWYSLIDYVAGCEQPEPNYVSRTTHWGRIYTVMEALREKGLIYMEQGVARRNLE